VWVPISFTNTSRLGTDVADFNRPAERRYHHPTAARGTILWSGSPWLFEVFKEVPRFSSSLGPCREPSCSRVPRSSSRFFAVTLTVATTTPKMPCISDLGRPYPAQHHRNPL